MDAWKVYLANARRVPVGVRCEVKARQVSLDAAVFSTRNEDCVRANAAASTPLKAASKPEDIAAAAVFFAGSLLKANGYSSLKKNTNAGLNNRSQNVVHWSSAINDTSVRSRAGSLSAAPALR